MEDLHMKFLIIIESWMIWKWAGNLYVFLKMTQDALPFYLPQCFPEF